MNESYTVDIREDLSNLQYLGNDLFYVIEVEAEDGDKSDEFGQLSLRYAFCAGTIDFLNAHHSNFRYSQSSTISALSIDAETGLITVSNLSSQAIFNYEDLHSHEITVNIQRMVSIKSSFQYFFYSSLPSRITWGKHAICQTLHS